VIPEAVDQHVPQGTVGLDHQPLGHCYEKHVDDKPSAAKLVDI
jgi:hypothetical protein